jgi:peroxiredoxin
MSWPMLGFGMILPWLVVLFGCWLFLQLLQQNGRILLHLEALEEKLGNLSPTSTPEQPGEPGGLAPGTPAPAFELPDLEGRQHKLADFRGRRLLLIFFDPGCGFCAQLAPDLAALPIDGGNGKPIPLVISTGTAEANRLLLQPHGVRCRVLLQKGSETSGPYQAAGTPMGYLIDEQGQIASELAVGAPEVLSLMDEPAGAAVVEQTEKNGHAPRKGKANKGLAASRLNRDGLKAGTLAPAFRLPRLDGGELALEELRGRRVLLVFSDPECGPCEELAPHLQRWRQRHRALRVVMISRGAVEANQAKAAQLGLTFPIVLQQQWEISRLYGMFATPIAYLIDEAGVIVKDVAVGVEPILALEGDLAAAAATSVSVVAPSNTHLSACGASANGSVFRFEGAPRL